MWRNIWTVGFLAGYIQLCESATLRYYQGSLTNYTVFSLNDPTDLLKSSSFDATLPTVVYTFGYRGKTNGPATSAMINAYIDTKKRNVVLLDWEKEARTGLLGISLSYAASALPNSKRIGDELGAAILKLYKAGLDLDNLHLIGHSLGAHLMGFTGRWIRVEGLIVPRITGLDPARALFEGVLATKTGLDKTCAKFVDIIHTNPGNYGITKSTGTVDIWPNYSKDGIQPGCPTGVYPMFSSDDLCSHNRAVDYYAESLKNGTAFPAASASSYESWLMMREPGNDTVYLGELVNIRASGNYYLSTNAEPPYSRGIAGLKP